MSYGALVLPDGPAASLMIIGNVSVVVERGVTGRFAVKHPGRSVPGRFATSFRTNRAEYSFVSRVSGSCFSTANISPPPPPPRHGYASNPTATAATRVPDANTTNAHVRKYPPLPRDYDYSNIKQTKHRDVILPFPYTAPPPNTDCSFFFWGKPFFFLFRKRLQARLLWPPMGRATVTR